MGIPNTKKCKVSNVYPNARTLCYFILENKGFVMDLSHKKCLLGRLNLPRTEFRLTQMQKFTHNVNINFSYGQAISYRK